MNRAMVQGSIPEPLLAGGGVRPPPDLLPLTRPPGEGLSAGGGLRGAGGVARVGQGCHTGAAQTPATAKIAAVAVPEGGSLKVVSGVCAYRLPIEKSVLSLSAVRERVLSL